MGRDGSCQDQASWLAVTLQALSGIGLSRGDGTSLNILVEWSFYFWHECPCPDVALLMKTRGKKLWIQESFLKL